MRILIIGSEKEWAFENHYIKHLRDLGVEVDCYAVHDLFYSYYYKSIVNKLIFRLGLSNIYNKINNQLLTLINNSQYNIIWVFKGMEIYPQTLKKIREKKIKLVNLNPDHPFIHTTRGSGNNNVLESIPYYDLHLCYNLPVKKRIEEKYHLACEWLPFGYEQSEVVIPKEKDEIKRACFIGNPDAYRAQQLLEIIQAGIPLDLFGNAWDKWIKPMDNADINFFPPIYKENFNKVASKYRLQLNIFRPHNDNSHNMRTFEMPGLACIMLAPDSEEHQRLFTENKEAFFYRSSEEMIEKAHSILDMNYETALAIRYAACNRSAESGYTYKERAKQVLSIFKNLLN